MCLYVSPEKPTIVRESMNSFGIDTSKLGGQLRIVPGSSIYQPGFKAESVLSAFRDTYDNAVSSGFTGLRSTDITTFGQESVYLSALVESDRAFDEQNPGITSLCIYENFESYNLGVILKLIACHSSIVWPSSQIPKDLSDLIPAAIESGLSEVLGPSGAKAILLNASNASGITPTERYLQEVGKNPELFHRPLEQMFGRASEQIIASVKTKVIEMSESKSTRD